MNTGLWDQTGAAVVGDSQGNFVVVWRSEVYAGSDNYGWFVQDDVRGQRFGSDGSRLNEEFQVNTFTTHAQADPAVVSHGRGDFAVVWTDGRGPFTDIWGQRFGVPLFDDGFETGDSCEWSESTPRIH